MSQRSDYLTLILDPTCVDGVKNQDETDVDCGGSVCSTCALNKKCGFDDDCSSGYCNGLTCGKLFSRDLWR